MRAKKSVRTFYFYRGEMIERYGKGWCWSEEMCRGNCTGIPVYKTIEDAKNAIRKYLDGTHKAEPRIIFTLAFDVETRSYYPEN